MVSFQIVLLGPQCKDKCPYERQSGEDKSRDCRDGAARHGMLGPPEPQEPGGTPLEPSKAKNDGHGYSDAVYV